MSRAEFIRFLKVLEEDLSFRALFQEAEPEEILKLADQHGFIFSDEIFMIVPSERNIFAFTFVINIMSGLSSSISPS